MGNKKGPLRELVTSLTCVHNSAPTPQLPSLEGDEIRQRAVSKGEEDQGRGARILWPGEQAQGEAVDRSLPTRSQKVHMGLCVDV